MFDVRVVILAVRVVCWMLFGRQKSAELQCNGKEAVFCVNAVGHAAWRLVWLSLALGRSLFVLLCVVRWCLLSGFGACCSLVSIDGCCFSRDVSLKLVFASLRVWATRFHGTVFWLSDPGLALLAGWRFVAVAFEAFGTAFLWFGCVRVLLSAWLSCIRSASCFGRVPCLLLFVMLAWVSLWFCALCVAGGHGACVVICTGSAVVMRAACGAGGLAGFGVRGLFRLTVCFAGLASV